jgi:hypothetical protein
MRWHSLVMLIPAVWTPLAAAGPQAPIGQPQEVRPGDEKAIVGGPFPVTRGTLRNMPERPLDAIEQRDWALYLGLMVLGLLPLVFAIVYAVRKIVKVRRMRAKHREVFAPYAPKARRRKRRGSKMYWPDRS